MMHVLHSIVAFVVALGLLVTVHEFGHFWVARRLGVKILRFSVGFGRPLWSRRFGADATEFCVAAIPLGGYVKMLDEREGEVRPEELPRAFNRQRLAVRTAVVVAGPVFNFLFAIAAYWLMFVVGITGLKPVVGQVTAGSPAAHAGLHQGDRILSVEDEATPTWDAVVQATVRRMLGSESLDIRVREADGHDRHLVLDLASVSLDDVSGGDLFQKLGIRPQRPQLKAVIGRVIDGQPAAQAGLKPGDRIVSAGGKAIHDWGDWVRYVQNHPDQTVPIVVDRGGSEVTLSLHPKAVSSNGKTIGRIGAIAAPPKADEKSSYMALEQYGPLEAVPKSVHKTWEVSTLTLRILGKMLFGQASVENLSGPISIAQYAGESASIGLTAFLAFLGIVSVSLGVLNLLPVPLLDGGHLLYYLIEFATGRPVSASVQAVGQQIGLVMLLGLMGLAFYNDLMRIFG